jgi:hypothetical protein
VHKPDRKLLTLGAQAVENTISGGEQTGKIPRSLIRRRFVPALVGKLTTDGAILTEFLKSD